MEKFKLLRMSIFFIGFGIMILMGCQIDATESLYDPDAPEGSTPEINSVSPANGALAGVGEVTITGNNFSSNTDEVMVFFNSLKGHVLEASTTQLVVRAPNVFGDSIQIKIAIHKTELFSNIYIYKLRPAVDEIGNLMDDDVGFGIATDMTGNLYVSFSDKEIKKIMPSGETSTFVPNTTFLKANNMKMGPDNTIYAAVAAGRIKKIATIDADCKEGTFTSIPASPRDLDFDANGNIWVAADGDIYLVKPDKSKTKITSFPVLLRFLRVFNGYVYMGGKDETTEEAKIWRAEIHGEQLGDAEVVLDVAAAGWLEGSNIYCITFTGDGEMLLGTDHSPDAIFVYREVDGSHNLLYPGLIESTIYSMSWDEGNFLYVVRQFEGEDGNTSKILRLDMAQEGAPYFGRK